MGQLVLELAGTDPHACSHRAYDKDVPHVWCRLHDTWTNCGTQLCGEMVGCAYEEPDNSPEAVKRRMAWVLAQKEVGDGKDE